MEKIIEFLQTVIGTIKKLNICITTGGLVGFFAIHLFNLVDLGGVGQRPDLIIATFAIVAVLNWILVLFMIGFLMGYGIKRIGIWSLAFSLFVSTCVLLLYYRLLYPLPPLLDLLAGLIIGMLLGQLFCVLCNLLLGVACRKVWRQSK